MRVDSDNSRKLLPAAQEGNFLMYAYLVLVDKSGQAVWRTHGAVNDAALAELKKQVAKLEAK